MMTRSTTCVQCGEVAAVLIGTAGWGEERYACARCHAVFRMPGDGPARVARPDLRWPLIQRPLVNLDPVFRPERWQLRYRRRRDRALATVPLYRERSAPWHTPPPPLDTTDLEANDYRLCPFSRPWNRRREPSLWIGTPDDLRQALGTTGVLRLCDVVLEFRGALTDRVRLGGRQYAVLLTEGASVRSMYWRSEHNTGVLEAAVRRGTVTVVGSEPDLESVAAGAPVTPVGRAVLQHGPTPYTALVHDPYLGYVAARHRQCGTLHVNWRRYFVSSIDGDLAWTDLLRSRPTLLDVRAGQAWSLTSCPLHRVPGLSPR